MAGAGASGATIIAGAALPAQAVALAAAATGAWVGGEYLAPEDKRILLKGLNSKKQEPAKVVETTATPA